MNILVYIDNDRNLQFILGVIRRSSRDARVWICRSLQEAWSVVMTEYMNLMIFDLELYGREEIKREKLQFLDRLRSLQEYRYTWMFLLMDMEDVRFHGYNRLHSFACYEKPLNEDLFQEDLEHLIEAENSKKKRSSIKEDLHCFRRGRELYVVTGEELVRVESHREYGFVVTPEKKYEVDVRSIRQDAKHFGPDRMIRCSRSDYVNPYYIRIVEKNCILLKGDLGIVELSPSGRKNLLRRMRELAEEAGIEISDWESFGMKP